MKPFYFTCSLKKIGLGFLFLFAFGISLAQPKKIFYTEFDPLPGNEDSLHVPLLKSNIHRYWQTSIGSSGYYIFNRDNFQENAVLANPALVDTQRYQNLAGNKDFMFLMQQNKNLANQTAYFFQLLFPNLKTGSEVTFKMSYQDVQKANPACDGHLIPLKIYESGYQPLKLIQMGEKGEYIYNTTVRYNSIDFSLYLEPTDRPECNAIALTKMEVLASPQVLHITSSVGSQIIIGEDSAYLQTSVPVFGHFLWQQKNGNGWVSVGTDRKQLLLPKQEGTYSYRLVLTDPYLDTLVSDTLTLKAISLCSSNKQVVFYDNFGRLDQQDVSGKTYYTWDHSTPRQPVEVKKTTTTPFRWVSEQVRASIFDSVGALEDGYYTVASYLTSFTPYNNIKGATLEWANGIGGVSSPPFIAYDRSKTLYGGVLLLNWGVPKGTAGYTKTVTGLCAGSQVHAEVWINVFTPSQQGVDVNLKLTDLADPNNFQLINGTNTGQQYGGGFWLPVRSSLTLSATSTGVQLELINNVGSSLNGNDLALDDVRIYACNSCLVTGIEEESNEDAHLFYPNPVTDRWTLSPDVAAANVYSSQGTFIGRYEGTLHDVSHWEAGMYQVVADLKNGKRSTHKVLKVNR